jgi:arsenite methyltransferase
MRKLALAVSITTLCTLSLALTPAASAQLASRSAEEWIKTLESDNRVSALKIDEVVAKLQLKGGETVADIGAGSGLLEVALAKAVSAGGKVYAVDIEAGLFPEIMKKAREGHVSNIQTVLGKYTDPNLPVKNVDVVLFHDVLHHIEDRAAYLKTVTGYLKSTGRVVVIDFEPGQGPHKGHPELEIARQQLETWAGAAGLKAVEEIKMYPDKYFLVYSR